jgi:CBS domain containing-hemolysin-like protein
MIKRLSRVMRPLTKLLSASTNLGIKVFNIDITREPAITEEELKGYIQEGRQTGVLMKLSKLWCLVFFALLIAVWTRS